MFKVGDKVKVIEKVWWIDKYVTDKIGIVIKIVIEGFPYIIRIDKMEIPVYGHEIEKIPAEGQMLFSFMSLL